MTYLTGLCRSGGYSGTNQIDPGSEVAWHVTWLRLLSRAEEGGWMRRPIGVCGRLRKAYKNQRIWFAATCQEPWSDLDHPSGATARLGQNIIPPWAHFSHLSNERPGPDHPEAPESRMVHSQNWPFGLGTSLASAYPLILDPTLSSS